MNDVSIASLILAVVAIIVSGGGGRFVRTQIRDARQQFEASGPLIQMTIGMGFAKTEAPDSVYLFVTAQNKGRMPAPISAWGFDTTVPNNWGTQLWGGGQVDSHGPEIAPGSSYVLSSMDSVSWALNRELVMDWMDDVGGVELKTLVVMGEVPGYAQSPFLNTNFEAIRPRTSTVILTWRKSNKSSNRQRCVAQ